MKGKKNNSFKISNYFKMFKVQIIVYTILNIINISLETLNIMVVAKFIMELTCGNTANALNIGIFLICLTATCRLLDHFIVRFYIRYSLEFEYKIKTDLLKHSFKLNSYSYDSHNTGGLINRFTYEPSNMTYALDSLVYCILKAIQSLVVTCYIAVLNVYLVLVFLAFFIVSSIIHYIKNKVREKNKKNELKTYDNVIALVNELVKSERDIKSLGLEQKIRNKLDCAYIDYSNKRFKTENTSSFYMMFAAMFSVLGVIVAEILGVHLMDLGFMTLATYIVFESYHGNISSFVYMITDIMMFKSDFKISYDRINELYNEENFPTEKFGNLDIKTLQGDIEFKDVFFSFKDNIHKNENKTLYENLSFKIDKNTTVAIVGLSGSGKSTILNLINKLYDIDKGDILFDGNSIKDLTRDTIRNNVSIVNQFPYIFDLSVKENLLLVKPNATDEELTNALKDASLYEFVMSLPKKMDTILGENGVKLSGGQKQRLAIARVMLRKTPIIIFDESTSSLDNFAQNDIKRSIEKMKGESTVIIVAHRLSTITNADKIFFLDNGKIVSQGTFNELLEKDKNFRKMFLND